jgi:hypothetical protein
MKIIPKHTLNLEYAICMNEHKFNNFTRVLIYKEFYQWVPMKLDFSNIFLGYYPNQTYIINSTNYISGILQKQYNLQLMEEYFKDTIG